MKNINDQCLLKLQDLSFAYVQGMPIFHGVNLRINRGDCILLCGENGAGKTTLFRCITGLEKGFEGKIFLHGCEVKDEKDFQKLRRKVGYVLQNSEDQLFFPLVMDDMRFGPLNLGLSMSEAEKRGKEALAAMGMLQFAEKLSYNLSGGEQKKIAIAAVLAMQPELLLLDEPFNGLDEESAVHFRELLAALPCARIIITHNQDFLKMLHPCIYNLKNQQLILSATL